MEEAKILPNILMQDHKAHGNVGIKMVVGFLQTHIQVFLIKNDKPA